MAVPAMARCQAKVTEVRRKSDDFVTAANRFGEVGESAPTQTAAISRKGRHDHKEQDDYAQARIRASGRGCRCAGDRRRRNPWPEPRGVESLEPQRGAARR